MTSSVLFVPWTGMSVLPLALKQMWKKMRKPGTEKSWCSFSDIKFITTRKDWFFTNSLWPWDFKVQKNYIILPVTGFCTWEGTRTFFNFLFSHVFSLLFLCPKPYWLSCSRAKKSIWNHLWKGWPGIWQHPNIPSYKKSVIIILI